VVWIELFLCAVTILVAGIKLSKYGDEIADRTGIAKTWIGLILLATVTSLPELISGVSAVTLNNLPNLAVGGVLGSCLFNLVILAFLDWAARGVPLSSRIHHSHVLTGGFGIILLALVCTSKLFGSEHNTIGWVDPFSIAYIAVYLLAMRTLFQFESKRSLELISATTAAEMTKGSLARPCLEFLPEVVF